MLGAIHWEMVQLEYQHRTSRLPTSNAVTEMQQRKVTKHSALPLRAIFGMGVRIWIPLYIRRQTQLHKAAPCASAAALETQLFDHHEAWVAGSCPRTVQSLTIVNAGVDDD